MKDDSTCATCTPPAPLVEPLNGALGMSGVVVNELRAALARAGAVEAIVLYDLIDRAVELNRRIEQLRSAVDPSEES